MARPRRVLVTGASRGIGRAIALELASRGVDLALTYHEHPASAAEAADLAAHHGVAATTHPYSLGSACDAEQLAVAVTAQGALDAIVLNAGVWTGGRLTSLAEPEWWRVVELNLRSAQQLVRAFVPVLDRDASPSITLVSSVVGLIGFAGDTAYASAKAALVGFGRSLAKELSPQGVRVNVACPGFVDTDMTRSVSSQAKAKIGEHILLGRPGRPEEVAKAIAFLALDATYSTGSVLVVDGGWSI